MSIGDVVSALGARRPAGAPWAAPFRQAFVNGLIPSAQEVQRRQPVQNDNSINVNIGHAGSNADEVIDQVYNAQAAMARPGFRNTPR